MKFDWQEVFLRDLNLDIIFEIMVRTLVMFTVILIFLRMSGKKGVKQLSIFEVAIIIALGSAAGDPMLNGENAIIPSMIVFGTILAFYRAIIWAAAKNERFERILEGDPLYIIEDGKFVVLDENDHGFGRDEFFSEIRQQNVEHLGQIRVAILETNGNLSIIYYDDDQVRPGLPVLPKPYGKKTENLTNPGNYACTYCGHVEHIELPQHCCKRCTNKEWVESIDTLRKT
jgi:uncharacterized membrane protein YcaP (DUF421 family)